MDADAIWLELQDLKQGLSPRRREIDSAHVAALAELEGRWPPILVSLATGQVIDGHHRIAAARSLGWSKLPALGFKGTAEDAFVEAVRRNVEHGLPLTIDERKRAADRLLRNHAEWSDRRIAEICALSPRTIARIRPARSDDSPSTQRRIGRDGRDRSVRLARLDHQQIVAAIQANPNASLRVVARTIGASPETVRQVRQRLNSPDDSRAPRQQLTASTSTNVVTILPNPGPSSSSPPPAAEADSAIASTPAGRQFASWFDHTNPGAEWRAHLPAIPLSRVYQIADQARQRARIWNEFAELLEQQARNSRAG